MGKVRPFVYRLPDKSKRVAYCRYHRWPLSARQVRAKGCLNKCGQRCRYLIRNEEHEWWRQREVRRMII